MTINIKSDFRRHLPPLLPAICFHNLRATTLVISKWQFRSKDKSLTKRHVTVYERKQLSNQKIFFIFLYGILEEEKKMFKPLKSSLYFFALIVLMPFSIYIYMLILVLVLILLLSRKSSADRLSWELLLRCGWRWRVVLFIFLVS